MSAPTQNTETTEPDNTNVGLIATVTIVGALLVVSTAAALTALVRTQSSEYGLEVGAYSNLGTVKRLKAEQVAKLEGSPAWSDKTKGLVSLPIDRAMGIVTSELSKNPSLATPEPPPSAQPAASGEPPAGVAPSAAPSKEKEHGPTGKSEGAGPHGDAKDAVKIDAPKGAPVVHAGAPAPHE